MRVAVETEINTDAVADFIERHLTTDAQWSHITESVTFWLNTRRQTALDLYPVRICTAAGGNGHEALPLAAFWTLSVLSARILDDVQDSEGSGAPWHALRNEAESTLLAFALSTFAQLALTYLDVPADTRRDIARNMSQAAILAARAQAEPAVTFSLNDYLQNRIGTSGAVWAATAWSAARIANASAADCLHFREIGHTMGMIGALRDDCKDARDDLQRGTVTLPVICGLMQNQHPAGESLRKLLDQSDELDVNKIMELLDVIGVWRICDTVIARYVERLSQLLAQLPADRAKCLEPYV